MDDQQDRVTYFFIYTRALLVLVALIWHMSFILEYEHGFLPPAEHWRDPHPWRRVIAFYFLLPPVLFCEFCLFLTHVCS